MDMGFKPTTHGRNVLIACMDSGGVLKLTRVAVGKGLIPEGRDLADQHELVDYVADGAIGDRRHENNRMMLSVQYSNKGHSTVPMFYLREFMVYAKNPDTGEETDLIYGTLGDYAQPVPPYVQDMSPAVFNLPLTIILSDEIEVHISAPAGLVTYAELAELVRQVDITIPKTGWVLDQNAQGLYPFYRDIPVEYVSARMIPTLTTHPESDTVVRNCGFSPRVQTMVNAIRVYARKIPTGDIKASLLLLANPPYVRSDGTSEVLTTSSLWNASEEEVASALGIG
ncbi:MAG: hypothetical protein IJT94_08295 [Oscillibacter sp.]|nr:hypothetical protein [Oscillibacter sp.]